MRGLFFVLWPLYLILVFALLSPVEVSVAVRTTLKGGYGELTVRFMTLRIQRFFRITLLERPFLTLERILPDGRGRRLMWAGMKKKRRPPILTMALSAARDTQVSAVWIAGAGDAAATALLCGLLKSATVAGLSAALPFAACGVEAAPRWDGPFLRLEAAGITTVKLAEIIRRILWSRSESKKWRIPWKRSCIPPSPS